MTGSEEEISLSRHKVARRLGKPGELGLMQICVDVPRDTVSDEEEHS